MFKNGELFCDPPLESRSKIRKVWVQVSIRTRPLKGGQNLEVQFLASFYIFPCQSRLRKPHLAGILSLAELPRIFGMSFR